MSVLDTLKDMLASEPTRDGVYYNVGSDVMFALYEEFARHEREGRLLHRSDACGIYAYLKEKKGATSPVCWKSARELQIYIDEIERLEAGRDLSPEERIEDALDLLVSYGQIDGAHHKTWCIDQVVRILVGPYKYEQWVKDVCDGEDGPDSYGWDVGIAP